MVFILVHEGVKGRFHVPIQSRDIHAIIKESLGRKRNTRLGATLLNFCSYTENMSPEEYAGKRMKWKIPNGCKRWLDDY